MENIDITAWFSFNRDEQQFEFNHYEDGLITSSHPSPLHPIPGIDYKKRDRGWSTGKWNRLPGTRTVEVCPVLTICYV